MILGASAVIIMSQIDVIMIGRLLDLSLVPAFTIAAFIATAAQIPNRAFQRLLQPLIAQALHQQNDTETWRLVRLTHNSMLLARVDFGLLVGLHTGNGSPASRRNSADYNGSS